MRIKSAPKPFTGKKIHYYHMNTEGELKVKKKREMFYLMIHILHKKKDPTTPRKKTNLISMLNEEDDRNSKNTLFSV